MATFWEDFGPIVLLVLAVAGLVAAMAIRLGRIQRKAAQPVEPVDVPPEEAELQEGPVYACMRCGSPRVRVASLSEGGIPGAGAGLTWICARCAHRGPALEFDDVTAYRQFVKGLHADRREE